MKGIDGEAVLAQTLDFLSEGSSVAANAPRSKGLTGYLSRGIASEISSGRARPYWNLTVSLIQRLSIWWSVDGYQRLPVMTPWCVRDRTCRYDQGPEAWSAPREDGYLRDDNSIIKKLPLSLQVDAPMQERYDSQNPWRGFTACHIWRELPGGKIAGTDPWLYSFMPNLVWLPRPLSALTDYNVDVMNLLKRTSLKMYRDAELGSLASYAEYAWTELSPQAPPSGETLAINDLSCFRVDTAFVKRRLVYLDNFVSGVDQIVETSELQKKLISSRYSSELPKLPKPTLVRFRNLMVKYRDAAREDGT